MEKHKANQPLTVVVDVSVAPRFFRWVGGLGSSLPPILDPHSFDFKGVKKKQGQKTQLDGRNPAGVYETL